MERIRISELKKEVDHGRDAFLAAHPHAWLVWDTSMLRPARQRAEPTVRGGSAPMPDAPHPLLCIPLVPGAEQPGCLLGRSTGCDISLNDSTLSARHLLFSPKDGGWEVTDLRSSNGSALGSAPLQPGVPTALANGAQLSAGDVQLTFHTAEGMYEMLKP